jgi:hypothetical protein
LIHSRQNSFDIVSGSSLLNVGKKKHNKTFSATVVLNHSHKASSSIPSVASTSLPKSNRYLAIKLHHEYTNAFEQLALSNPLSRKQLFSLFVALGYFRQPEKIASFEMQTREVKDFE